MEKAGEWTVFWTVEGPEGNIYRSKGFGIVVTNRKGNTMI